MANPFAKLQAQATKVEAVPEAPEAPSQTVTAGSTKLASMFAKKAVAAPAAEPTAKPKQALSSLEDLDSSTEDDAITESVRSVMSSFVDEEPATAPSRVIPEEATQQMREFADLMDQLYVPEILGDPELLGGVIRNIMIELKDNPQYMQVVVQQDIRTWVRQARNTMGLAKIRKQETKGKRTPSKGKKLDAEMMETFEDLGVSFDGI